MATDQLMAPLPRVVLPPGAQIKLEAIDPTSGAAVAGVVVENIAILGADVSNVNFKTVDSGPFLLVAGPVG